MADMYNAAARSDELSLLRKIFLRSSSSPFVSRPPLPPTSAPISSVRAVDYDCQSEERVDEALIDKAPAKPAPSRNPSKRNRAAEVHNLSEKRRRSKINEKMNELQKLIPNCNKTDKASMLDEAIEYLKQLQLQVQMLTMRNGLNLYPYPPEVSHPTQLCQMNMDYGEENEPLNISLMGLPHVAQETRTNGPNQITEPAHLQGPNILSPTRSRTSRGLGSSVEGPIESTPIHISPMEADIFRAVERLDSDHFQTNLLTCPLEEDPTMMSTRKG